MRLIYTVFGFPEEARSAAKVLIESKLAACANYWPIKSMFYMGDSFKEKDEVSMLIKVPVKRLDEARKKLRELNSYQVPSIIVLKPESVNNNYLKWVQSVDPKAEEQNNYDGADK